MKKLYTNKVCGNLSIITLVIFMISRELNDLAYMWLSFITSSFAIFISLKTKEDNQIISNILYIINILYTVLFGLMYVFMWCVMNAEGF